MSALALRVACFFVMPFKRTEVLLEDRTLTLLGHKHIYVGAYVVWLTEGDPDAYGRCTGLTDTHVTIVVRLCSRTHSHPPDVHVSRWRA